MSEILRVLNKKVELKSEVVELGMVDDFVLDADGAEVGLKRLIGEMFDLRKKKNGLLEDVDITDKLISEAFKGLKQIESTAKTLGIDKPKKVVDAEKKLNGAKKVADKLRKDLGSL